eukprot:scaffold143811_cov133-Phaeocystis_antarctica.AAC.1
MQGTRPCACDASKCVLNCDLTRPKAIAEAATLQGFDVLSGGPPPRKRSRTSSVTVRRPLEHSECT